MHHTCINACAAEMGKYAQIFYHHVDLGKYGNRGSAVLDDLRGSRRMRSAASGERRA